MGKLKIIGGGNEEMSTIPGLNQIQFEGFCRFIDRGLTEELYKFSTDFFLPFELISIILLSALIGAIVVARQ